MSDRRLLQHNERQQGCSRRRFIGGALSVAASTPLLGAAAGLAAESAPQQAKPTSSQPERKREGTAESIGKPKPFAPRRVASWWSTVDDLIWLEKRVRDAIRRRADALAAAEVDTVIQFGFHCRYDFAWCFGAVHGYLAEVAAALHERGIRFVDHFTCNLVMRPSSATEQQSLYRWQRHHVLLFPDAEAAPTAGYAGFQFDDLRVIDVETGRPAYVPQYQGELFCPNHPDFLAMHQRYLQRLTTDVPLDGLMNDDMCRYVGFRGCGCRFCRERFRREYGHELPPLADRSFWGDTGQDPFHWGNYENPAFRDWVRMGYRSYADVLAMAKRAIGPDRMLLTCCGDSGSDTNNATGESYESFIESCDWTFLENCDLVANDVLWANREPAALLQRAIARTKPRAVGIACSYGNFADTSYLAWAVARFWGVVNWSSTLYRRFEEDPPDAREEAELVGPYNCWERSHSELGLGEHAAEARIVFVRATRDNGWLDAQGRGHWARANAWARTLLGRDIGYRFVLADELADGPRLAKERTPLILDGCAHLDNVHLRALVHYLRADGTLWVVPPLGEWDAAGRRRQRTLLDELQSIGGAGLRVIEKSCAERTPEAIDAIVPRLRRVGGPDHWAARLLLHNGRPAVHLLNRALNPVVHPTIQACFGGTMLMGFKAREASEPLVLELRSQGLSLWQPKPTLRSPEWNADRPVVVEHAQPDVLRLTLDVRSLRLYAVVHND